MHGRYIQKARERKNRAQVNEYRDETFKHDAFLVVLLSDCSHSKASFFHLFFCSYFCFCKSATENMREEEKKRRRNSILPHGMRICCSLSIDSFCDFYSHFLCVFKKQITYPCAMCALAPSFSLVVYVVAAVVVVVVLYFSHNTPLCFVQFLVAYTIYIKRCYCCVLRRFFSRSMYLFSLYCTLRILQYIYY